MNNGPPDGKPLYNGHRAIWMQECDSRDEAMVGPRTVIVNGGVDLSKKPIWIEAPHIFKVKDDVLSDLRRGRHGGSAFGSRVPERRRCSGRTCRSRAIRFSRSGSSIESRPFPITTTGHADFVETQNGEWWAVFLGARPYTRDTYNTGRETFMLRCSGANGWPIILEGNATVP